MFRTIHDVTRLVHNVMANLSSKKAMMVKANDPRTNVQPNVWRTSTATSSPSDRGNAGVVALYRVAEVVDLVAVVVNLTLVDPVGSGGHACALQDRFW